MVILLGGAPRAGKGIISQRLVDETSMHLLSLDILKMGLHRAVPSLDVDPSSSPAVVGERMWPLVQAMAENALETDVECIFEGDMVLPKHAARLQSQGGGRVRVGFVGYGDVDPYRKLAEIRNHAEHPNDWLSEHSDDEVLGLIRYGIEFSRFIQIDCDTLGLRYFDCSHDFQGTVEAVVGYLADGGQESAEGPYYERS